MSDSRSQRLADGIAALGVSVDVDARDTLIAFLDLLIVWNQRIRLVGDPQRDDAVDVILVDSLSPLLAVPETAKTLLDVGSGAGLPGLVLAIARPELRVTTLEPIHKKHAFQRTAARELGLTNVTAHAQRLEDFDAGARFDVAVSRATFGLNEWLERGTARLSPEGTIIGLANDGAEIPPDFERVPYSVGRRQRFLAVKTLR